MIVEIIITSAIIFLVVGILWLARKNNIHLGYDASGLEAHPKEILKSKKDPSAKN